MKIVGKRPLHDSISADTMDPVHCLLRAVVLQKAVDQLNPYPRPQGFVYKAKTWEEYAQWRRKQANPRLW